MSSAVYWPGRRWFKGSQWLTGCTYVTSAFRQWHRQVEIHLWQVWKEVGRNKDMHCQLRQHDIIFTIVCRPMREVQIPPNILYCLLQYRTMKCVQFQPQVGLLILFLPLLLFLPQMQNRVIRLTAAGRVWPMGHCRSSSESFARAAHCFDWSIDLSATNTFTYHSVWSCCIVV